MLSKSDKFEIWRLLTGLSELIPNNYGLYSFKSTQKTNKQTKPPKISLKRIYAKYEKIGKLLFFYYEIFVF